MTEADMKNYGCWYKNDGADIRNEGCWHEKMKDADIKNVGYWARNNIKDTIPSSSLDWKAPINKCCCQSYNQSDVYLFFIIQFFALYYFLFIYLSR